MKLTSCPSCHKPAVSGYFKFIYSISLSFWFNKWYKLRCANCQIGIRINYIYILELFFYSIILGNVFVYIIDYFYHMKSDIILTICSFVIAYFIMNKLNRKLILTEK